LLKIVKKFFTKAEAKAAVIYQKQKARKENRLISNIEVIDACKLYRMNGWYKTKRFESLGLPVEGQFMLIIYYNANECTVIKTRKMKDKIRKAVKEDKVVKQFLIVKLREEQLRSISLAGLNYVSKISVSAVSFKYSVSWDQQAQQRNCVILRLPVSMAIAA